VVFTGITGRRLDTPAASSSLSRSAALAGLNCPHLGDTGCQAYAERPLICRLFGTTPRLACPNGKRPETLIDPRIEQQIYRYFNATRQVLV